MNVCVIAIAIMKVARAISGRLVKKGNDREAKRRAAIRLMWMPGVRPVNVPIVHPSKRAIISSSNILLRGLFYRR